MPLYYQPEENCINCIKTAWKLQKSFKTKVIAASTLRASIREGLVVTSAIGERWPRSIFRPTLFRNASQPPIQRLVSCVEVFDHALVRRRILSILTVFLIIWSASICLASAITQAQEAASKDASLTTGEPAFVQRSIEKGQPHHLLLSMVDRSHLDAETLRNSATQSFNPDPTDAQNAGEARLPSNPRGAEFASLAALASAPSSSLLYSIQAERSGRGGTYSLSKDNKAFVYQFGTVNLVINQLPNSFSVSPAASRGAGAR